MYAGKTTFCIHVPMFDAKFEYHMMRKSRYPNAARAVPGRGGVRPKAFCGMSVIGVVPTLVPPPRLRVVGPQSFGGER